MFRSVLVLGSIRGIRVQIHVSWLIIFALVLLVLSASFHHQHPDWSTPTVMITAAITVLVFFASIVAHEFGHSLVAIRRGIPVRSITLFLFGGLAQLSRDSESADDEFWIAIAGPLVSFALAALFYLTSQLTAGVSEPVAAATAWLALINFVVAVFNMVPGFPLDGGRVFRAVIWKLTGDAERGMRAAVLGGRTVAYLLFGLGLWTMLTHGNVFGGIWIMLIAWFLLANAEAGQQGFDMQRRMSGVRARELADRQVPTVAAGTSITDWVEQSVLQHGLRSALVCRGQEVLGLVSLTDIRACPRDEWALTPVDRHMTRRESLHTVSPETPAPELLQAVTEHNLNQIPVLDEGRPVGWIDRERLLRMVKMHMELGRG